jgi:hypothetical protein
VAALSWFGLTAATVVLTEASWFLTGASPQLDEFLFVATLFGASTALVFAALIALVHVPVALTVYRWGRGSAQPWLRASGALLAPLSAVLVVSAGRAVYGPIRGSLWTDLAYLLGRIDVSLPLGLPLIAGSVLFGIAAARALQPSTN